MLAREGVALFWRNRRRMWALCWRVRVLAGVPLGDWPAETRRVWHRGGRRGRTVVFSLAEKRCRKTSFAHYRRARGAANKLYGVSSDGAEGMFGVAKA